MNINEIISNYLTIDQQYIVPMGKLNQLKSKSDFYMLLKYWLKLSRQDTIGDIEGGQQKNTPLIKLSVGSSSYYINADTTRAGVQEFLKNREHSWSVISSNRGNKNKVTNDPGSMDIKGFYMYKN